MTNTVCIFLLNMCKTIAFVPFSNCVILMLQLPNVISRFVMIVGPQN